MRSRSPTATASFAADRLAQGGRATRKAAVSDLRRRQAGRRRQVGRRLDHRSREGPQTRYDVEITPQGDKLKVMGYAGMKFLSQTMIWTRAPSSLPKCNATQARAPDPAATPAPAAPAPAAPAPSAPEPAPKRSDVSLRPSIRPLPPASSRRLRRRRHPHPHPHRPLRQSPIRPGRARPIGCEGEQRLQAGVRRHHGHLPMPRVM